MKKYQEMKVLLVDHDAGFLGLLQQTFHSMGNFELGLARSGPEAVALFKDRRPHLILMDIAMPRLEGLRALEEILALDAKAHILIITALQQETVQDYIYHPETMDYICKNNSMPIIQREILNFIGTIFPPMEGRESDG